MEFKEIERTSESLDHLGFMEKKVYQIVSKSTKSELEIFKEILKSDIFFEDQNLINQQRPKPINFTTKFNGPLTEKINQNDFHRLNYTQLKQIVKNFEENPNWGKDLSVFQKLMSKTKEWIEENNYQNEYFYFINSEEIAKEKLVEENFFSYFISLIMISIENSKVAIVNHGGD